MSSAEQPAPDTGAPVTPLGWFAFALAAAWVGLDQATKYWILQVVHLPVRGSVPVLPFFNLSMVWNRGVSFGLLRAEEDLARWGLALFALAVAVALGFWARRTRGWLTALAFGLLMGGAVGNAIDRARFGAVADFLDFSALHFPWVFNVADCGVTVGVALLLLDSLVGARKS